MQVQNANRFGALPLQRLEQFEALLGTRLPDEYRQFLLQHNGGKPTPSVFMISADEGDAMLHHVYGLHDGPLHIRLDRARQTYLDRMPRSLFPIADDPGGNAICLGISGNERGKVYFWDHEMEADEGDEPTFENVYLVAESFASFLKSLKDLPKE